MPDVDAPLPEPSLPPDVAAMMASPEVQAQLAALTAQAAAQLAALVAALNAAAAAFANNPTKPAVTDPATIDPAITDPAIIDPTLVDPVGWLLDPPGLLLPDDGGIDPPILIAPAVMEPRPLAKEIAAIESWVGLARSAAVAEMQPAAVVPDFAAAAGAVMAALAESDRALWGGGGAEGSAV